MSKTFFIISSEPGTGGVSDYADRLDSDIPEAERLSLPQSRTPAPYIKSAVEISKIGKPETIYNFQIAYGHFGPSGMYLPIYIIIFYFLKPTESSIVISLHEIWSKDSYQSARLTPIVQMIGELLHTIILLCADSVVFLSENGKDKFTSFISIEKHTVAKVIPHGVPYPQSSLSHEEARDVLGVDRDQTVIATIGFINERKNTELLLEIAHRNPEYSVLIAGGPRSDSEQSRVKHLQQKASSNVIMTGRLPDNKFHAAFQAANVIVLPYHDITQSGILNWCAAYSSPVVTTQLDRFSSIEDTYGWPKTAEMYEIPDTVIELVHNSRKLDELVNSAEKYAEDHSHTNIINRYRNLFFCL